MAEHKATIKWTLSQGEFLKGTSKTPTAVEESQMHHAAHEGCFIANSVKTEVKVATASRRGNDPQKAQ